MESHPTPKMAEKLSVGNRNTHDRRKLLLGPKSFLPIFLVTREEKKTTQCIHREYIYMYMYKRWKHLG